MKVVNVRINGMENPVGFDFETVCVSWKVRETSARRQQNVKIEIALTEDFSELLWTKEGKNLNSAAEKPINSKLVPSSDNERILTVRRKNWNLSRVHIQDIM